MTEDGRVIDSVNDLSRVARSYFVDLFALQGSNDAIGILTR